MIMHHVAMQNVAQTGFMNTTMRAPVIPPVVWSESNKTLLRWKEQEIHSMNVQQI